MWLSMTPTLLSPSFVRSTRPSGLEHGSAFAPAAFEASLSRECQQQGQGVLGFTLNGVIISYDIINAV